MTDWGKKRREEGRRYQSDRYLFRRDEIFFIESRSAREGGGRVENCVRGMREVWTRVSCGWRFKFVRMIVWICCLDGGMRV